ncbi:hypothetical protein NKH18_28770 [Streptomyces sp. M10(2022)]
MLVWKRVGIESCVEVLCLCEQLLVTADFVHVCGGQAAYVQAVFETQDEELRAFGIVGYLTDKHLRGRDRRITRQVAAWAVAQRNDEGHQLVQGITYRSGYAGYQCWAILRDTELKEEERRPIRLEDRDLREVASEYELTIR